MSDRNENVSWAAFIVFLVAIVVFGFICVESGNRLASLEAKVKALERKSK